MGGKNTMVMMLAMGSSCLVVVVVAVLLFVFRDKLFKNGGNTGPSSEIYGSNAQEPASNGFCPDSEPGGSPACEEGFVVSTNGKKCCTWNAADKSGNSTNDCPKDASKNALPTFFWGSDFAPSNVHKPMSFAQGSYADEGDYFSGKDTNHPGSLRVPKGFVVEIHSKENFKGEACHQFGEGQHQLGLANGLGDNGNFKRHGTDSWKIFCGKPNTGGACPT